MEDELQYVKSCRMLFMKNNEGNYEPLLYNCYEDEIGNVKGTKIESNSIYKYFIAYVRYSSDMVDKSTGEVLPGFLEMYQYKMAFSIIDSAMNLKAEDFMGAISRQAGKSYVIRLIASFCLVFIPIFKFIKEQRYCVAWCSPTKRLAVDQLLKLKPFISKGVEFFNTLFPDGQLITKEDDVSIRENMELIEINRAINGQIIPYSSLIILSLNKVVINAGFSLHMIFSDEAQEVNESAFNMQVKPTTARTGGCVIAIGTTIPDQGNLLYSMYLDKDIPDSKRCLIDWEEVYKLKEIRDPEDAERYMIRVEKDIKKYGKTSEYIQTQYYVNFKISGGKFVTLDKLNDLNVCTGSYGLDDEELSRLERTDEEYIIGGFDGAKINDYAGMSVGTCKRVNEKWQITSKLFLIFNHEKQMLTPDDLTEKVKEVCMQYKIDMLTYDTTGQQDDRAYYLYKDFKKNGIGTLIVPYNYSGMNKRKMFTVFEDVLNNSDLILPRLDYQDIYPTYKETIDELLYFKKELNGTLIEYKAPEVTGCYDDMVNALAMMCMTPYYVERRESEYYHVKISETEQYPLELQKYNNTIMPSIDNERISNYDGIRRVSNNGKQKSVRK